MDARKTIQLFLLCSAKHKRMWPSTNERKMCFQIVASESRDDHLKFPHELAAMDPRQPGPTEQCKWCSRSICFCFRSLHLYHSAQKLKGSKISVCWAQPRSNSKDITSNRRRHHSSPGAEMSRRRYQTSSTAILRSREEAEPAKYNEIILCLTLFFAQASPSWLSESYS